VVAGLANSNNHSYGPVLAPLNPIAPVKCSEVAPAPPTAFALETSKIRLQVTHARVRAVARDPTRARVGQNKLKERNSQIGSRKNENEAIPVPELRPTALL
jgi:hypothetical protein